MIILCRFVELSTLLYEGKSIKHRILVYNYEVEVKSRSVEFDYQYPVSDVSVTLKTSKMINMRINLRPQVFLVNW